MNDSFDQIPPEVWRHISEHLSIIDLLRCELTCKSLRTLTHSTWESGTIDSFEIADVIDFKHATNPDAHRMRCVLDRIGGGLKALSFTVSGAAVSVLSSEITDTVEALAPCIQCLKLENVNLTLGALLSIGRLSTLEALSLCSTHIANEMGMPDADAEKPMHVVFVESLSIVLRALPNLNELHIVHPESARGHVHSVEFLDAIASSQLRVLDITIGSVSTRAIQLFLDHRSDLGGLVEFSISVFENNSNNGALSEHEWWDLDLIDELVLGVRRPSVIRSLVDKCPLLKRLRIVGLESGVFEDFDALRGLELLDLRGSGKLSDDHVTTIRRGNPALEEFHFDDDSKDLHEGYCF